MLESVKAQLEKVMLAYEIEATEKDGGPIQMVVKAMPTMGSRETADIMIVLPPNYPQAKPNGFSIKNENGTWNKVCFSPQSWDPAKDTLWKWLKMIECFFKENPQ